MSNLLDKIKSEMLIAFKAKDNARRDILKVVMSECSLLEFRTSKTKEIRSSNPLEDSQVLKVISKIIENNKESLKHLNPEDDRTLKLTQENSILSDYLPKTISLEETLSILENVEIIQSAKSEGQATGEAIKFLKISGKSFDNKIVSEAVKIIRS